MASAIRRKPVPKTTTPPLEPDAVDNEILKQSLRDHCVDIHHSQRGCKSEVVDLPTYTPLPGAEEYTLRKYETLDSPFKAIVADGNSTAHVPVKEGEIRLDLDEQLENLKLEAEHGRDPPDLENGSTPTGPVSSETTQEQFPASSRLKNAFSEAKLKSALHEVQHLAGGFLSHPYEATKHYAILRHSSGLVYYSGPATSIAITVFSDRSLPEDRTLWLQKRGYSGDVGMKIKAASRGCSSWIDVTPVIDANAYQLPAADERAWQRDIAKFLKKGKTHKTLCNHRACETDVLRIPHIVEDGYFRAVLCAAKTVLCVSPVFRYASSSLDPSRVRGAGLSSLPLELGIKLGSVVAKHSAANFMQPVANAVQSITQPYQLDGATELAVTTVYDSSGAADKVEMVNQEYEDRRELDLSAAFGGAEQSACAIGEDDGPQHPYPIRFSGRLAQGLAKDGTLLGLSTASLADVDEDTVARLSGVYMGWCAIPRSNKSTIDETKTTDPTTNSFADTWHQCVVIAAPRKSGQISVVQQKDIVICLCHDFGEATLFNSRVDILVMGFIHPLNTFRSADASEDDLQPQQVLDDINTTKQSLDRIAWSPDTVLERIRSESSNRSVTQRMADARSAAQKRMDKVPIHMIGVRSANDSLKDQLIGRGGICVKR